MQMSGGPWPLTPLEITGNPHFLLPIIVSPDHRTTPEEAWKMQCHHLPTVLRHSGLAFNPDCLMTAPWTQANMGAHPPGQPITSDLACVTF